MPTRKETQSARSDWTFSCTNTTPSERKKLCVALGRIQLATRQPGSKRRVKEIGPTWVTVSGAVPVKYDATVAWLERVLGDFEADWEVTSEVPSRASAAPAEAAPAEADASRAEVAPASAAFVPASASPAAASSLPASADPADRSWPPVTRVLLLKCLRTLDNANQKDFKDYVVATKKLGEGTFGKVFAGVHAESGRPVALKCFKRSSESEVRDQFFQEALFLREVGSHPNVVPLLDVTSVGAGLALVFPRGVGLNQLRGARDGRGMTKPEVIVVSRQLFLGLAHVHSRDIFHGDIKPDNLLVMAAVDFQFASQTKDRKPAPSAAPADGPSAAPADGPSVASQLRRSSRVAAADFHQDYNARARYLHQLENEVVVQICDFGAAMCLHPAVRSTTPCDPAALQTLWWRAPEVLLGSECFGLPADIWSAGLTMAELSLGRHIFAGDSMWDQVRRIIQVKGTPGVGSPMRAWPQCPKELPNFSAADWPRELSERLGEEGVDCLNGCTWLTPCKRLSAQGVAEHSFLDSMRMHDVRDPLGGTSWVAQRGLFRVQQGVVSDDVFKWIRGDPWFWEDGGANQHLERPLRKKHCMTAEETVNKVELCFSASAAGGIQDSATFNSMIVHGPCPAFRLAAWAAAFKTANSAWLLQLGEDIVQRLARHSEKELGHNGFHFLAVPPCDWFNYYFSVQFMRPGERQDPKHFDGGASILAGGLTLWGRRTICLEAVPVEEESPPLDGPSGPLLLPQTPGAFYQGNFASPSHWVVHDSCDESDLFEARSGETFKVAVIFRSSCFAAARARTSSSPPGPKIVFDLVSEAVHRALGSTTLRLPTLSECLAAHRRIACE